MKTNILHYIENKSIEPQKLTPIFDGREIDDCIEWQSLLVSSDKLATH